MPKIAKHLKEMDAESLEKLQTGFNRFRFGFANFGETCELHGASFVFLGDFGVKYIANEWHEFYRNLVHSVIGSNNLLLSSVHPYIFGKRKTGWNIWMKLPQDKDMAKKILDKILETQPKEFKLLEDVGFTIELAE